MKSEAHEQSGPEDRIRVGISSCLLGESVRFDGGHKRDAYVNGTLARYFELVPVCPEVAIGLGVPREPIRLVGTGQGVRVLGVRNAELDVTDALRDYGRRMARELDDLSGYILKRASPSCGMERVKVYRPDGTPAGVTGAGAYAQAFMAARPLLPVEEEGRLGDPALRENFVTRVFVYHRWQRICARGLTPAALVDFHTRHKLLVMAHSQAAYRRLGRLVAEAGAGDVTSLGERYLWELMTTLKRRAGRGQHANVLQHLQGFLKKALDAEDRAELAETIDAYRRGLVPLVVPLTLLKHHFRRHPHPYVERQHYLEPHPAELMLRNLI